MSKNIARSNLSSISSKLKFFVCLFVYLLIAVNFMLLLPCFWKTVVRTVYGNSKGFEVKVGMHQGTALSPLLFVIVMEAIPREFRVACHGNCCMLMTWQC